MSGSAPRDRGLDNYAAKVVDALHFCRPATAGFNQLVLITLLRDALRRLLAPDASCPWAPAKVRGERLITVPSPRCLRTSLALARCRDHGVIRCLGVIAFAFAPLCLCLHQMCPLLPAIPLARRLCPHVLYQPEGVVWPAQRRAVPTAAANAAAASLCLWPTAGAL